MRHKIWLALHLVFLSFSFGAVAQVHEILLGDTAYIEPQIMEDSATYFTFKNSRNLAGRWIAYYDEQKQHKAMEAAFNKGKLEGSEKQWYESGKLLFEKKCENDTCTSDYYYENGVLMKRDIAAIDAIKGTRNVFYSAAYCDNGQIKYSPPLNPDSPDAQFITSFYCSGSKKEEFTLLPVSGKHLNIGPYTEWFENGAMKVQGYYDDTKPEAAGKKTGPWNYYDPQGKLILQERYENGELKEKMEY